MSQTIDLYQDNDRRLRVLVRTPDLDVVDITGAEGVFTVKFRKEDAALIQKSTNNASEGFIGAADEGEMFFLLVPADTTSLDIIQYYWDVRLNQADGTSYTVATGVLNLLDPVNP